MNFNSNTLSLIGERGEAGIFSGRHYKDILSL